MASTTKPPMNVLANGGQAGVVVAAASDGGTRGVHLLLAREHAGRRPIGGVLGGDEVVEGLVHAKVQARDGIQRESLLRVLCTRTPM